VIYFIKSGDYLKVGYSSDVAKRMKQYATHNPDFELLYIINGDEQLEKEIHTELKDYHHRLEWFHMDDYVKYMIDYLREKYKDWVEDEISILKKMRDVEGEFIELLKISVKELTNFPATKYFKQKWAKELKVPFKNIDAMIRKLVKKEILYKITEGIYGMNVAALPQHNYEM